MSTETLPTPDPAAPVVKRRRPLRWLFWRTFWACAAATMFIGVFFKTGFEAWLTSTPRGQQANKIGVQVIDDVARFLGVAEKKVEPATDTKTKQAAAEPVAKKPDDPVKPEPPAKTETAATGTPAAGVAAAGEKPAVPAVKPMTSGPTPGEPWPIKGDVRTRTVTEKEPVEDGFPRPKK